MSAVFIDTDVVLDFLTNRDPHAINSMKLFDLAGKGQIKIFISSLSINNIYYLIRRLESHEKALQSIRSLMLLATVLPVGKSTIEKSLASGFKDFEDGVQNFCAEEAALSILITRNVKDYSKSRLSIQTPGEFLAA
jgi:predicted nucleic acid-binding protein